MRALRGDAVSLSKSAALTPGPSPVSGQGDEFKRPSLIGGQISQRTPLASVLVGPRIPMSWPVGIHGGKFSPHFRCKGKPQIRLRPPFPVPLSRPVTIVSPLRMRVACPAESCHARQPIDRPSGGWRKLAKCRG